MTKLLIDGYNLMFASQLVGRGRGPGWLEAARNRLIRLLRSKLHSELLARTVVVFDAQPVPFQRRQEEESEFSPLDSSSRDDRALKILYASDHDDADEMILSMIQSHPTPKQLSVVSSDQRIRRKTQARAAISWTSESFLEQLERGRFEQADAQSERTDHDPHGDKDSLGLLDAESIEQWKRTFNEES